MDKLKEIASRATEEIFDRCMKSKGTRPIEEIVSEALWEAYELGMPKPPSEGEISKAVKQLAKESTAPDKDTPDWMESDIRRGIMWAIQRLAPPNN